MSTLIDTATTNQISPTKVIKLIRLIKMIKMINPTNKNKTNKPNKKNKINTTKFPPTIPKTRMTNTPATVLPSNHTDKIAKTERIEKTRKLAGNVATATYNNK